VGAVFNARAGRRPGDGSASATSGSLLVLPRITLNSILHSDDLFVEIPIPAFASVESVAASGICQGTTLITCHFFARDPVATDFVETGGGGGGGRIEWLLLALLGAMASHRVGIRRAA